jgi:hypothetical protein
MYNLQSKDNEEARPRDAVLRKTSKPVEPGEKSNSLDKDFTLLCMGYWSY